jgi:hypothetical protein
MAMPRHAAIYEISAQEREDKASERAALQAIEHKHTPPGNRQPTLGGMDIGASNSALRLLQAVYSPLVPLVFLVPAHLG